MKFLIDSSAWIEYLEGSFEGEKVRNFLMKDDIYSLNLIIAEVVSKVKRNNRDFNLAYKIISSNSKIIQITPDIAKDAGVLHADMKKKTRNFGMVDSIILIAARKLNAKVLTGDKHFRGFKEAVLIWFLFQHSPYSPHA